MVPLLVYSAQDIDTAGIAVDAALPLAWLAAELAEASLEGVAPAHVKGRLSRTGNEIVVRARIKASLTTPCARCLQPAALEIDTELSLLLRQAAPAPRAPATAKAKAGAANGHAANKAAKPKPKAKAAEDEYEFSGAEADTDTYDGEAVVLDPFVREAILLEVPNFPLCSEGCTGIRPPPSVSMEEAAPTLDPRLAPLAALRSKLGAAAANAPAPSPPPKPSPKRSPSSSRPTPKPTTETKAPPPTPDANAPRKAEPPKPKQKKNKE